MEWTILAIVIALAIVAKQIIGAIFGKASRQESYGKHNNFNPANYEVRKTLMTPSERLFFEKLKKAIGEKYDIYPQVNLDKIFKVKYLGAKYLFNAAKWAIDRRSVDFLVVDRDTQSPLFAVELDDSSHEQEDRIARDEKVSALFKNSGLDLIRFNSTDNYLEEELRKVIKRHYS
jgi:very-short-patch-repair endonuclease